MNNVLPLPIKPKLISLKPGDWVTIGTGSLASFEIVETNQDFIDLKVPGKQATFSVRKEHISRRIRFT
jgi:hypothetical protein